MSSVTETSEPTESPASTSLQRLMEPLQTAASRGSHLVYGDAVDRRDTTVIPVARVQWGFGGGGGGGGANHGSKTGGNGYGFGGGGGIQATPVGYIEILRNGLSRFRPIRSSPPLLLLILGLLVGGLLGFALRNASEKE